MNTMLAPAAEIIVALHARTGLTQVELAERLGVTQPAISMYLSGRDMSVPVRMLARAILEGRTQ